MIKKHWVFNRSLTLAALLALFIALPAQAHSIEDNPVTAAPPPAVEVIAGTVEQLTIEDRVKNTTRSYYGLQRDDGTTVLLTGPSAEGLQDGARVELRGQHTGAHFSVHDIQSLAPPSRPDSALTLASALQVEGTLTIIHADDFEAGKSRFLYHVSDDAGGVTTLSIAALPSELRGGMRVIVSGLRDADASSLHPQRITILTAPEGGSGAKADMIAKVLTTSTVLVILANFSNTNDTSLPQSQAQQVMVTNADSVANYYNEVSYGQQQLNVTVTPWVNMSIASPGCNYTSIGNAADAAATAAGFNSSSYNFVVYLFSYQPSCGWAGLAYVGFPHKAWINGTGSFRTQVIAHEMGHNFGLLHAGSLNCGTATIGGTCNVFEYGDPWDTMGNQRAMHFNARQKSLLNWIPTASVKTHTSGSASYTLNPIESPGGSVYAVKIPTASSTRTYWLEFRQPLGFDAPLSAYPNNGAQIRVANPFEWSSGSDDTEILDMTPGSAGGFGDSALVVGQGYLDSTYGINVIVTGASASALTVSVTTGGGAATVTTLSSSSNPSTAGTNVTFTATVTGTNPTGSVNFKDAATSIAACSAVALTGSGNSRTAACTTNTLAAGTHSIVATYSGDAANAASSSGPLSQVITGTTSVTLTVTPTSIAGNGTVTASWSGINVPTATDWIGLFVPGAPSGSYIDWIYVSCSKMPGAPAAAGACPFVLPNLAPGTYELRLFANSSYTILAQSNAFTVTSTSLNVTPTSVAGNGTLTASWGGISAPTSMDWIGLFVPGAAAGSYIDWIYASCSKTPGAPVAAGSCPFVLPNVAPGTYELRLFANNSYTVLAKSNTVAVTGATSLNVTPTSVASNGTLSASWSGISAPTATDWIGLFVPGAPSGSYINWIYVSCSKTPVAPAAAGSCPFVLPNVAPGTYELRLSANNGFTVLAKSNTFTVTP